MNEERYILTVQSSSIFKEVDVSKDTPLIKIGVLQDCGVRLKRELFPVPVCVTLKFDGGEWRVSCNAGLHISSRILKDRGEVVIRHGDILNVHDNRDKAVLLTLSFSYDFTAGAIDFDTIIDIRGVNRFIIGGAPNAQIKLGGPFVGSEYITLTHGNGDGMTLDATHAPNSATLNGIRVFADEQVGEYDFIGLADYSFYFKNQVLYTTMREDLRISGASSIRVRNVGEATQTWEIDVSEDIVIGRDANCRICVADRSVSRRQCKLLAVGGGVSVENLSRTNTTLLNGKRLDAPSVIKAGDKLKCGRVTLIVDSLYVSGSNHGGNMNMLTEYVNV
jgi:hypothetical protein